MDKTPLYLLAFVIFCLLGSGINNLVVQDISRSTLMGQGIFLVVASIAFSLFLYKFYAKITRTLEITKKTEKNISLFLLHLDSEVKLKEDKNLLVIYKKFNNLNKELIVFNKEIGDIQKN